MSEQRFEFDFNRVTYREVLELNLEGDDESKATEETIELIARVTVKWPHDGDATADGIKDLGLQDFADLQAAFSEAMDNVFKKRE